MVWYHPERDPQMRDQGSSGNGQQTTFEDLKVQGEDLLSKVRELVREGNVRRIIIKNGEGRTRREIPLTLGVAGAVMLPTLAAVGAIAALVTECSIMVERVEETPEA